MRLVALQQAPSRGMDTLGGGKGVAEAASPRLALARKLMLGIKGITNSEIQARQAHVDHRFALASALRAVRSDCRRPMACVWRLSECTEALVGRSMCYQPPP